MNVHSQLMECVRLVSGLRKQTVEVQLYCPSTQEYLVFDLVTAYKTRTQHINVFEHEDTYRLRVEDQHGRPRTIILVVVTDAHYGQYCVMRDEDTAREYQLVL